MSTKNSFNNMLSDCGVAPIREEGTENEQR